MWGKVMQEIVTAYRCTYDERLNTPTCFINQDVVGLNLVQSWDAYCSHCGYGNKHIGIATVNPQTKPNFLLSKEFSKQKEYLICCKKQAEMEHLLPFINPLAEKISFYDGQIEDFSFLEKFPCLTHIRLSSSRCTHLWDIQKTPNLMYLSVEGKQLFDISAVKFARNLRVFEFTIATSRMDRQNIQSLVGLSNLPLLERVEIQGARLQDENIDHLISIPNLKSLWVSPDMYSTESFAKFEKKKFKINEEYGIFLNKEEDDEIWRYGNDCKRLRISKDKPLKIQEYLDTYYMLMSKYE